MWKILTLNNFEQISTGVGARGMGNGKCKVYIRFKHDIFVRKIVPLSQNAFAAGTAPSRSPLGAYIASLQPPS